MTEKHGTIVKVAGPLITASGMGEVQMYDVVHVSDRQLIGEVIELRGDTASVQVYEETGGIGPGEPVYPTGAPLRWSLARGLSSPFTTAYRGRLRFFSRTRGRG